MKNIFLPFITIGLATASIFTYASTSPLPGWATGDMNCKIDGRPAKMNWKVVDDPQMECDPSGRFCSSTSSVKTIGAFSDNGGSWVSLSLRNGTGGNILTIRYLGAEQNDWHLNYNPPSKLASGWTTWRGNRYPLECWKGDVGLVDRCNSYATKAVQQYQAAQNLMCGFDSQGGRWQGNFDAHKGWCMASNVRIDWLDSETNFRQTALSACRNRLKIKVSDGVRLPFRDIVKNK